MTELNLNRRSKTLNSHHKNILNKLLIEKIRKQKKTKVLIVNPVSKNRNLLFNVLNFGVRNNGNFTSTTTPTASHVATNNVKCIQQCFNLAAKWGGTVFFPNGNYLINGPITMNCNTNGYYYSKQPSIIGQSTSGTCITQYSTTGYPSGYASFIINGQFQTNMTISNLSFDCQYSTLTSCCAIYLSTNTNMSISNVTVSGGYYGIYALNVFSSLFNNVFVDWSGYCAICFTSPNDTAPPNSLTFINCNVAHSGNYGYYFYGGTTISITGGGVQGTGQNTSPGSSTASGIYVYNGGSCGTNTLSLTGVYFELNNGIADIYLKGFDYAYTSSISGCNFNRLSSTFYTTYNIYNENSNTSSTSPTYCLCSVNACGFGLSSATTGGNDYVESSSCPYIYSNSNTYAPCSWTNCMFYSSVAVPTIENAMESNYGNVIGTS